MRDLLFRQVHPGWLDGEQPSSQAFRPMPKDNGLLSIYLGSLTTPELSYKHYTEKLKFESAGVWAVSIAEVEAERLPHRPNPQPDFPAHGEIDFSGVVSNSQKEKIGKRLKNKAVIRGKLHP